MFIRIGQTLAATAVLALTVVSVAAAQPRPLPSDVGPVGNGGAFVIQSCGETGSAEGWSENYNNDPSALASGIDCPPSHLDPGGQPNDFQQAGLWVSDRLGNDHGIDAAPGDRVELAFVPTSGTLVRRVRWWRSVFKQLDDHWQPYTAIGDPAQVSETCNFAAGHQACGVGGTDWLPYDDNFSDDVLAYRDVESVSATRVAIGARCRTNADNMCGNGYSLTSSEVQILSAFLTIADGGAPMVDGVSGGGWGGSGWRQGVLPLVVGSSDVTGISATKVYADGSLIAMVQRACRYDRPRPCSDEGGAAVGIPTVGLADGAHQIDVGVVDAAGNETKVRRSDPLLVDNEAPATPVGVGSSQATSNSNNFSLTWSLPADSGAPIVAAHYQVCQAGTCGEARTAASATRIDGVAFPAIGDGTVRVWLEDQLGHSDPARAATVGLTYAPPPPSPPAPRDEQEQQPFTPAALECVVGCGTATAPPSAPVPETRKRSPALKLTTLRRVGRRVTIAGTVDASASGRVTVRYRVRIRGRTRALTKRVAIVRRTFRTTLTLSPTLAAARSATVSVAYPGDADTAPQTRTAVVHTRA